jgi:hypothetical protein
VFGQKPKAPFKGFQRGLISGYRESQKFAHGVVGFAREPAGFPAVDQTLSRRGIEGPPKDLS